MPQHTQTSSHTTSTGSAMRACIDACQVCHDRCLETLPHCLNMGGEHAEAKHIGLMLDCAQICQTSADFMLRQSPLHAQTCGICADIFERCANDCVRFSDDVMQACAQACQTCAESCRKMASMGATTDGLA